MKKEIEVKIEIPKDKLNNLLKGLLLILKAKRLPRIIQKTYGFFTPDGLSIRKGIFPRIRVDNGIFSLTVKIKKNQKGNYFQRDEYTIKIDDLEDGKSILKALGYTDIKYFFKIRTPFYYKKGIELFLDNVPKLGYFLEIETSKKEIEKIIKILNLGEEKRITKSYLGLIEGRKRRE